MKRKVLFLAVSSLFADAALAQTPVFTGATAGSSATTGQHTTVSQGTQRAIFDWASFNIGQGNSVTFEQPNLTSVAVNRISGGRTTIDGTLTANGHIMLLNQNGVLFGSTAVVNVGALTASTGGINAASFMAGTDNSPIAITGAASGSIENQGTITAGTVGQKGLVAFVAPSVINSGTITALGGRIVLAGAQAATVTLALNNLYELAVDTGINGSEVTNERVDASRPGVLDTGAASGFIVLTALDTENAVNRVINLSGVQRANRIEVRGGTVYLSSDLDAATVTGDSTTINVSGAGKLQDAVDIAKTGATIDVLAGTYAEQVTLNKSLTLIGAGADQTFIAPTSLAADNLGMKSIVTVGGGAGTSASISGFTVQGPVAEINAGIFVRDGAFAHIFNNKLIDIRESVALSGNQRGQAIFVGRAALNTSGRALIENNIITGYQKGGIVVDGPGSMGTILGNTVTGEGPTAATAQNGIQVSRGASATVTGNTVSGNHYTPATDEATGILIFTPGANLALNQGEITVGANNVSGNEVGIWTNDPRTLSRINLAGITGNVRNAVADFAGGFAGQGALLAYPAWAVSNLAEVRAGAFGGKQSGDLVDIGGSALSVTGWSGFSAIQPAVDAVAAGATINVDGGTYAESVILNGLRNLQFAGTTIQGLTINTGGSGSGIGGSVTANGSTGFLFNPPIRLLGNTSLATTGAPIAFLGDIRTEGGTPYALSLNAGGGDVSMVSGGTQSNPLGHFNVLADDFNLASTLWVSGYDINAAGNVALSDHTLNSVGALLSLISAGGNVTGSTTSQGSVQIAGGGDVITNIISLGNVEVIATNVAGNITGGFIVIGAENNVNANVSSVQVVEITSGGAVNVSGTAQSLVLNAAVANASGNFGEVVNSGGGVVNVNGKPRPPERVVALSVQTVVPTTVVIAADSEARPDAPADGAKPVLKPTLKLLTAEAKEAQPSGLSNAAELLRRGQSVEIDLTPGNN